MSIYIRAESFCEVTVMPSKRPATRSAVEEKKAKHREAEALRYAHLTEEQRRAKAARINGKRKKVAKIDRDRAADHKQHVEALNARIAASKTRIQDLKDSNEQLKEAYVLQAEEPSVDDAVARAAETAFKRAYKKPKVLQKLTHETPTEFDELWALVEKPLAKINYRGEIRTRSAGARQKLPTACSFSLHSSSFVSIQPTRYSLSPLAASLRSLCITTSSGC